MKKDDITSCHTHENDTYFLLLNTVANLQDERAEYQKKARYYEEEYEQLRQMVLDANRQRFGQSSERYIQSSQPSLFGDIDPIDSDLSCEIKTETITYTRKKTDKADSTSPSCPKKEIIIEAKDKTCACGLEKKLIRYDISERLHHQPEVFEVHVEKREVLGCPNGCECSITTAAVPPRALPKVSATEELLSYIAISKVLDRQPLYHLEKKINQRFYWHIPRQTMARWMIQMSHCFIPLINLMKDVLTDYDVAYTDATKIQVLNEPNRPAQRKSYAHCFHGGEPGKHVILFDYIADGQKDFIAESFTDYSGYLHVDGDRLYRNLPDTRIKLVGCHAHARRKYEAIAKKTKKPGLAHQAMAFYTELYKVERFAKDAGYSPEQCLALRNQYSKPLLDEFKAWIDQHVDCVPKKSPIGNAFKYSLTYWEDLEEYLSDGRLDIDNNSTERWIKRFVMARKNFLFASSQQGADALGVHFSLILTAEHHGLNPYHYYVAILKKIPYCKSLHDYEQLLPWNIKIDSS